MRIEDKIKELIVTALTKSQGMNNDEINEVGLELSRNKNNEHGDFSSNIALKLSGKLKRSPMVVAEEIINSIHVSDELERTEFVKPGFINFYLSAEKNMAFLKKSQAKEKHLGHLVFQKKRRFF